MPIEKIVDSLDNVEADLHGFYTQKEDGKFHLEDVTALRNTMKHVKTEKTELAKKVKDIGKWEALGKTPEEIAALLAAQAEDAERKARESGDHEAILNQHRAAWSAEKTALTGQVDIWRNKYQNTELSHNLTTELVSAEATKEGVELLPNILKDRVKFEVDGQDVKIKIMSPDKTTPMAGSGADGQATFADLVKEAKTKFPSLFKGTGHSGSGASDTDDKGGDQSFANLKRSQLSVEEKTAFIAKHGEEKYLKLPY